MGGRPAVKKNETLPQKNHRKNPFNPCPPGVVRAYREGEEEVLVGGRGRMSRTKTIEIRATPAKHPKMRCSGTWWSRRMPNPQSAKPRSSRIGHDKALVFNALNNLKKPNYEPVFTL